jgi:hypothetical protein
VLPEAFLPAGAYAVVVPEAYNAADGKDPAPRDGTLIVRVPGRLAGDGLANTGEPVRLLTAGGDVISQYGGWVDVSATAWSGKSVKRASPEACDSPDAWSKSPSAPRRDGSSNDGALKNAQVRGLGDFSKAVGERC